MYATLLLAGAVLAGAPQDHTPSELLGTWRGTSTCTDRLAAPACHDESVIYDFSSGAKSGTVTWKADKVVDGKREPMGEMELAYDPDEKCWAVEVHAARQFRWCLAVDGTHLTGTGRLLPGKETVRKIDVRKD